MRSPRTPAPEEPVHLGRTAREAAREEGSWVGSTVPPPQQDTVGHEAEERKVRGLSKEHVLSQRRTTALAEPVHLGRMARRAAMEEDGWVGSTVPPPPAPSPPPHQATVDHKADQGKVRGSSKEHVRSEPINDRQYFGTISRFTGSYGLVDCRELIKDYLDVRGVFLHINDCSTRPRKWDRVSFRLAESDRGCPKAVQVRMGWDNAVQDGSWKATCSCIEMTCSCVQPKSQIADTRGSSSASQHSSRNTEQPISGEEQTPDHVAELTKPESPRIVPASWEHEEEVEHADSTVRQMPANGAVRTPDVAPDGAEHDTAARTTPLPASSEGGGVEDEGGDAEADGQNSQSRQSTGARKSPSSVSVHAEVEEALDEASAGFGLLEGAPAMGKPDLGAFFQGKKVKKKKKLKD